MKAIVFEHYGPPEVLHLGEVDKPVPKDNEVLINIRATAVTSGDVRLRRADPFISRFFLGLTSPHPKKQILGSDLAGDIVAVGKDVTRFKVGDAVFGSSGIQLGAYAEYICLPEDAWLTTKPDTLTYEEAASACFGGHTALYFLRKADIQRGQDVLIYGASGAIGTAAVQLANYLGAQVTGVCSTLNLPLVESLGAHTVIDYTKENFAENGHRHDIIFDTVGKSPFSGSVKSLKENGVYLRAVHITPGPILRGLWTSMTTSKKVIGGMAAERLEALEFLKDLFAAGHLKPVVDQCYPLEEMAQAHRYVDLGHKIGNVVITVGSNHVDQVREQSRKLG